MVVGVVIGVEVCIVGVEVGVVDVGVEVAIDLHFSFALLVSSLNHFSIFFRAL